MEGVSNVLKLCSQRDDLTNRKQQSVYELQCYLDLKREFDTLHWEPKNRSFITRR